MKAMPAAKGARRASYNWKEAVTLNQPELVVKSGLDQLVAEGADYEELIDLAYQERLARVQAAITPEPHQAFHGLDGIDHGLLWEKAREDVEAAFARADKAEAEYFSAFGVSYRPDTSSELAELLNIDLSELPRLKNLQHLLSARTADGGRIPGRFYKNDKPEQITMGSLELVFSADKSISVAEALMPAEDRALVQKVQRDAVNEAMLKLSEKTTVRNRKDGLDVREVADVTWVQWQHRFSRRGDPQMHTHVSLLNVARSRESGKVSTIDTFKLHGHYHAVRETYHRELARGLSELGMPVSYDSQKQAALLHGIPDNILQHFSGRKNDAVEFLRQHGVDIEALSPKEQSRQMTRASWVTRPNDKTIFYTPGNGHAAWHARAVGQGYVPPPRFVDPQALQRAGIVHATYQRRATDSPVQGEVVNRAAKNHPRPDTKYNRRLARYDEAGHKHGRSL